MSFFKPRKNNDYTNYQPPRYKATIICKFDTCSDYHTVITTYSLISQKDAEAKLVTALDDHQIAKHDG